MALRAVSLSGGSGDLLELLMGDAAAISTGIRPALESIDADRDHRHGHVPRRRTQPLDHASLNGFFSGDDSSRVAAAAWLGSEKVGGAGSRDPFPGLRRGVSCIPAEKALELSRSTRRADGDSGAGKI